MHSNNIICPFTQQKQASSVQVHNNIQHEKKHFEENDAMAEMIFRPVSNRLHWLLLLLITHNAIDH